MVFNDEFVLRTIAGHGILIREKGPVDMRCLYHLSESAMWLFKQFTGKDFSREDLISALCLEYDVDRETASGDVSRMVAEWKKYEIIIKSHETSNV